MAVYFIPDHYSKECKTDKIMAVYFIHIDKLKQLAEQTSRRWIKGMGQAFSPIPT